MKRLLLSGLIAVGLATSIYVPAAAGASKPAFPSWSSQINATKRFTVLTAFGGAAVLDTETGLVWEQSPSISIGTWGTARNRCNQFSIGGRFGWRLPTIQELASLIDPINTGGNPDLPPGHPFSNVQSSHYWSATTFADDASLAWHVNFHLGDVEVLGVKSSSLFFVWCVRGGSGVDPQ